jgi:hypothetical protein
MIFVKMKVSKTAFLGILIVVFIALAAVVRINAQNSAIVIHSDEQCAVFDGNMNIFTTEGYKAVVTKSANGNLTLTCKAEGVPNDTGKVLKYSFENTNIPCVFLTEDGVQITKDWKEVLSPSGHASYICHFKSN